MLKGDFTKYNITRNIYRYFYHFPEIINECEVILFLSSDNPEIISTNIERIDSDVVMGCGVLCVDVPEDIVKKFEEYISDPLFEIELLRKIENA